MCACHEYSNICQITNKIIREIENNIKITTKTGYCQSVYQQVMKFIQIVNKFLYGQEDGALPHYNPNKRPWIFKCMVSKLLDRKSWPDFLASLFQYHL